MTDAPQDRQLPAQAADNLAKLKQKLRELFQLDRGDLDFGLYRIMAMKSAEVGDFLDNELLPQINEALGSIIKSDVSEIQKELENLRKMLEKAGVEKIEEASKIKELHARIKVAKNDQQIEADTYNHLYNFFSRYYDAGDFMSLRRYKSVGKEAYSIPYNGEEVKLHWANSDQYYIKTTENYSSYIFTVGEGKAERRVRFEVAAADNEKDIIKEDDDKKRSFVLSRDFIRENEIVTASDCHLIIRFDHRPLTKAEKVKYPQNGSKKQNEINKDAEIRILGELSSDWKSLLLARSSTEVDAEHTLLSNHIATYTAKNSFDYFIHKDLGGFLRRELDFYLKSEVLSIENLELADDPAVYLRSLAQIKAIKQVGGKIIDFLAQLENFQKQLWLKKKFVLETQYCVTLNKVPESLYSEIAENEAQREEWVRLFAIDELKGDAVTTAYSKSLKSEFLKENPYLVLDTRHFDEDFKDKLLAAFSDVGPIEEQINGLLVHGENFQALNLLCEKYEGKVKCIYIDPPYNTASSEILYKNSYKHSSWASLINDRISHGKRFITQDGFNMVTIDYAEFYNLGMILDGIFGQDSRVGIVTIFINPKGRQHERFFSSSTEYMIVHAKNVDKAEFTKTTIEDEKTKQFDLEDGNGNFRLDGFARIRQSTTRNQKSEFFYPIFVSPDMKTLTLEEVSGYHKVLPVNDAGEEYSWKVIPKTFEERNKKSLYVAEYNKNGRLVIYNKYYEQQVYKNIWFEKKYFPEFQGTQLLKNILGEALFDYPKSVYAVSDSIKIASDEDSFILDYFSGSGTTGHAVVNLNREEGGNRKYILVEIGHHFENVLLPRMKKVIYSKDWKNGKPIDRGGMSQLFQYIRLESYEDALDSLTVKPQEDMFEAEERKKFIEDYKLRYALGEETAESVSLLGEDFRGPSDYVMSVVRDGARRKVKVDIAGTFNFLLGLRLVSRRKIDDILAITGVTPKGENCLILWRKTETMDSSKLDEWFTKHREIFSDNLNLIYVNGDHTLNALKQATDKWDAISTESVFKNLMFGE